jgi:Flp pilus assembly protein TadD
MNRLALLALAVTLAVPAKLGAQEIPQQARPSMGQQPAQQARPQGEGFSQLDIRRPDAVNNLNGHLARLAENPRDVAALIGAGEAALALNDARAATGFFARADEIESGNGRIKAGLGRAMLEMQNPGEALRMFDQATRMNYPPASFLSDRALARDLTGDQAGAQRDYQAALQAIPDDAEIKRRYAVSLGISRQVDAAEALLKPLLYKGDRAGWRDWAFILAMNGRRDQARDITSKTMPKQLADAIQPYMERMQTLTPAQRAAAVHFGHFPSEVRMAAVAAQPAAVPPTAPVPAAKPVSAVEQRRQAKAEERRQRDAARNARLASRGAAAPAAHTPDAQSGGTQIPATRADVQVAAAVPPVPPEIIYETSTDAQPGTQQIAPAPEQTRETMPERGVAPALEHPIVHQAPVATRPAARTPAAAPAALPSGAARVQEPARAVDQAAHVALVQGPPEPESVAGMPASQTERQPVPAASAPLVEAARIEPASAARTPPPPAPVSTPATNPQATRTLADIMRELTVPEEEKQARVPAVALTDLEFIQQQKRTAKAVAAEKARVDAKAKAKAEADAKAKAEAAEKARLAKLPPRAWVQVGTGRDIGALAFTMKGLRKKYDSLATRDAFTASWGRTNRLVVGPFASFTKAKEYEDRLKKGGADAFAWQSDAGEEVDKLAGN